MSALSKRRQVAAVQIAAGFVLFHDGAGHFISGSRTIYRADAACRLKLPANQTGSVTNPV
jgi:hypothetical protein